MTENTVKTSNFKNYAHIFNVFLLYFRKVNAWLIPIYLGLVLYFEKSISADTYWILAIGIPAVWCVLTVKQIKMSETIGLFVRYRELKKWNKHVILDSILLFCVGYLLKTALLYFLIDWNWYLLITYPIADLLDIYVIMQVVFIVTDLYRDHKDLDKEKDGFVKSIKYFIRNTTFGDWLAVCYRMLMLFPVLFAVCFIGDYNTLNDNVWNNMQVYFNISLGCIIVYTLIKYKRNDIKDYVKNILVPYIKCNIKLTNIIVGLVSAGVFGIIIAFVLGYAMDIPMKLIEYGCTDVFTDVIRSETIMAFVIYTSIFFGIFVAIFKKQLVEEYLADKKSIAIIEEKKEEYK